MRARTLRMAARSVTPPRSIVSCMSFSSGMADVAVFSTLRCLRLKSMSARPMPDASTTEGLCTAGMPSTPGSSTLGTLLKARPPPSCSRRCLSVGEPKKQVDPVASARSTAVRVTRAFARVVPWRQKCRPTEERRRPACTALTASALPFSADTDGPNSFSFSGRPAGGPVGRSHALKG